MWLRVLAGGVRVVVGFEDGGGRVAAGPPLAVFWSLRPGSALEAAQCDRVIVLPADLVAVRTHMLGRSMSFLLVTLAFIVVHAGLHLSRGLGAGGWLVDASCWLSGRRGRGPDECAPQLFPGGSVPPGGCSLLDGLEPGLMVLSYGLPAILALVFEEQ